MNSESRGIQPQDIREARLKIARALGLSHLALGLGAEVVEVVERMHGTISRAPLPWQKLRNDSARGLSRLIYRMIHGSFHGMSQALAQASQALDRDDAPEGQWLQVRAAINGVCGDRLAAEDSPLAIPMKLLQDTSNTSHADTAILVIHGLCMSELGWHNPTHLRWRQDIQQDQDVAIHELRYNTGLHISDNGRALSNLLETQLQQHQHLHLIGHSMGGLLIRAAQNTAEELGHQWPQRLRSVACLGSPHHGAPMERIGNHANRILTTTPYLNPLSRLGAIRSAGIQDLRHGIVKEADWRCRQSEDDPRDTRTEAPLRHGPKYLFLAANITRENSSIESPRGHDYLVPVRSALGFCPKNQHTLEQPKLQRAMIDDRHHMDLLSDPQVYQHLSALLQS